MAVGTGGKEFNPARTPGTFGALPPDAPREQFVNDPSAIQATPEQVAMARRYEQELAPLTFKDSLRPPEPIPPTPAEVIEAAVQRDLAAAGPVLVDPSGAPITSAAAPTVDQPPVIVPPVNSTASRRRDRWAGAVVVQPSLPEQPTSAPILNETVAPPAATPALVNDAPAESNLTAAARALRPDRPAVLTEDDLRSAGAQPDQPYRPAASDTDSPSRGQPTASPDPNRRITGGFSGVGDAQYFPLDGMEVRELINGLLSQLHERLKDDLRFTIATTYPRCKVKVEITVEAFGMDHAVVVGAIAPPHTKTPIEVARERADEIVFVIVAERNEKFTADGDGTSTNQTRRDLGLEVPFKRQVGGVTFDRA